MSANPSRKRAAEGNLTQIDEADGMDRYDSRDGDETFDTTPQIASAEEMKTRRVVRVSRPQASTTGGTPAGGFFKGLPTSTPGTTSGGFDSKNPFGASFASNIKPAFGTSTASFGFGSTGTPAASTASGATTEVKPSFSFGQTTEKEAAPKTFSFGFGTTAEKKTEEAPSEATSTTAAAKPPSGESADAPKKLFGSSATFSFSSAVGSFVEARKKMEEETKPSDAGSDAAPAPKDASDSTDKGALTEVSSEQDVETLLRAPVKLFVWKKEGEKPHWAEAGVGDAQLVKQQVAVADEPEKKKVIHRLLVRDGYSLNVLVSKGHLDMGATQGKQVTLSVLTPQAASTYTMKFSGPTGAETAKQFGDKLSELLKE